jgi:hypothetical protein
VLAARSAIVTVAGSGYAALDLLGSVQRRMCVLARLRLEVRLFDSVPSRQQRVVGRRRTTGRRQRTLAQCLSDPHTRWQDITLPTGTAIATLPYQRSSG